MLSSVHDLIHPLKSYNISLLAKLEKANCLSHPLLCNLSFPEQEKRLGIDKCHRLSLQDALSHSPSH
jgi:hypothetical protein